MSRDQDVLNWIEQADSAQQNKEFERAEQLYERALRVLPGNEQALLGLGMLYVATGRGPLSLRKLQRAQKDHPELPGPYRAIATLIRISGHVALGQQYFQGLLQDAPDSAYGPIHLGLAEIQASIGDSTGLKKSLSILREQPLYEPLTQGMLHMEVGDAPGLRALAQRTEPGSLQDTLNGMSCEAGGDISGASQHYFNASNHDDPTWFCLNALAAMWLNNNNLNATAAYLKHAEEIAPNASEVQITRARYLAAKGEWEEARALLRQIGDMVGNYTRVKTLAQNLARKV